MPPTPRIDTHAHVFTRDLPMAKGRRYQPQYDATAVEYLATLDAHGFDLGVLVQPSFLGADNSYLLAAIAEAPERLRGVAVLDDPGTADFGALHARGIRGIRLNLVGRPVPDLSTTLWQATAIRLAQLNWHLEVQADECQWIQLAPHVRQWPGRIVIDHLGLPRQHDTGVVTEFAALDTVWVKLSAPYRSPLELAEARARQLVDAGLIERMVFGSDWPFTQHEDQRYGQLAMWARRLVGDTAFDETLPQNAARLFGFS